MKYWLLSLVLAVPALAAPSNILNVSYDVTREFYQEYNVVFARAYQEKNGIAPTVELSNGGSSKQARAVIDGFEADVVTMNQETDIDAIVKAGIDRQRLEIPLAEQLGSIHFDDRFPGSQGKPERH